MCNGIEFYNKVKIKYENAMQQEGGEKKYVADDYKSVI